MFLIFFGLYDGDIGANYVDEGGDDDESDDDYDTWY